MSLKKYRDIELYGIMIGGGLLQLVIFGAQDLYVNEKYSNKPKPNGWLGKKYYDDHKYSGKNNFYKNLKNKLKNPKHVNKEVDYIYNNYKPKYVQENYIEPVQIKVPKVRKPKLTQKDIINEIIKSNLLLKLSIGVPYDSDEMKNTECPILLGDIENEYVVCKLCDYCFDAEAFIKCTKGTCPMCRAMWQKDDVEFGNIDGDLYSYIKNKNNILKFIEGDHEDDYYY